MSVTPARSPIVSVVIPTHDRLSLLREAVSSVRDQTFDRWELIVVDDGSTDGTVEWLESIRDERVQVVRRSHTGDLAVLRNTGIDNATGRYLAFLDSDDLWEPDKLEIQLRALRGDALARWSYSALRRVDIDGEPIIDPDVPPWRGRSGWIFEDLLRFRAVVDTPTLLVETSLMQEIGGFDAQFGSWVTDYDLIFRLGLASPAVAVDRSLTRIRVHGGAHSADRAAAHRGWAALYAAFAGRVPSGRLQRICRRESRRHRLRLASRLAENGRLEEALAEALPVLRVRPWWPDAWRVVLWHVLRRRAAARRDPDRRAR